MITDHDPGDEQSSSCVVSDFSSRCCERGTRSCNVRHDPGDEVPTLTVEKARELPQEAMTEARELMEEGARDAAEYRERLLDARRPPPPHILADALEDRIAPASGRLIASRPVYSFRHGGRPR